jgi:hypothetical protein
MESYVARVAQSVERSAVNRKVGGSNPPVSDFLKFKFNYFMNKFRMFSGVFNSLYIITDSLSSPERD